MRIYIKKRIIHRRYTSTSLYFMYQ